MWVTFKSEGRSAVVTAVREYQHTAGILLRLPTNCCVSRSKHLCMNDSFAAVYFALKFQITPSRTLKILPASNNIGHQYKLGRYYLENFQFPLMDPLV